MKNLYKILFIIILIFSLNINVNAEEINTNNLDNQNLLENNFNNGNEQNNNNQTIIEENNTTSNDTITENNDTVLEENQNNDTTPNDSTTENNTENNNTTLDNTTENNTENNDTTLDNTTENNDITPEDSNDDKLENEIPLQYTKVSISKLNEKNELIAGAKLQIIDSEGNIINEWISDGTIYEIMLPAGKYTLHEVEAPIGYELAEDSLFEIESIIEEIIIGDVNWSETPCDHGENNQTPLYYVEINNISYEVYCINQGVDTPDGNNYDGKIITPDNIRDYTKQETNIDTEGYTISGTRINVNTETISDYDVSDQTLTNQELYDKVLDIIYHRQLAVNDERFKNLSTAEIRFITEFALKNYLNARITTYETVRELKGTTIDHVRYNVNGEIWQTGDGTKYLKLYNKYYNREYLYDESSPTGYIISPGNGDSFGNFAKHWYSGHGKVKIPKEYAELFYYLISDENKHPETMQLYIYSPTGTGNETIYQNLLGITGFLDNVEIQEESISLKSNYSTEKIDITVNKVWNESNTTDEKTPNNTTDNKNDNNTNKKEENNKKPESITVNLYADENLHDSVELSEENNWTHTFEDLDKYNEGNKITYTVEEVKVPNYKTEISGNEEEGFTIINTPEKKPPIEEEHTPENPKTGDDIYKSFIMLFISLAGLTYSIININFKKEVE